MKSAISITVTGALSGPLLGARTGSKVTVSAARAAVPRSNDNASSKDKKTDLFIVPSPFKSMTENEIIFELINYTSRITLITNHNKSRFLDLL
jgi:hypothetical protein